MVNVNPQRQQQVSQLQQDVYNKNLNVIDAQRKLKDIYRGNYGNEYKQIRNSLGLNPMVREQARVQGENLTRVPQKTLNVINEKTGMALQSQKVSRLPNTVINQINDKIRAKNEAIVQQQILKEKQMREAQQQAISNLRPIDMSIHEQRFKTGTETKADEIARQTGNYQVIGQKAFIGKDKNIMIKTEPLKYDPKGWYRYHPDWDINDKRTKLSFDNLKLAVIDVANTIGAPIKLINTASATMMLKNMDEKAKRTGYEHDLKNAPNWVKSYINKYAITSWQDKEKLSSSLGDYMNNAMITAPILFENKIAKAVLGKPVTKNVMKSVMSTAGGYLTYRAYQNPSRENLRNLGIFGSYLGIGQLNQAMNKHYMMNYNKIHPSPMTGDYVELAGNKKYAQFYNKYQKILANLANVKTSKKENYFVKKWKEMWKDKSGKIGGKTAKERAKIITKAELRKQSYNAQRNRKVFYDDQTNEVGVRIKNKGLKSQQFTKERSVRVSVKPDNYGHITMVRDKLLGGRGTLTTDYLNKVNFGNTNQKISNNKLYPKGYGSQSLSSNYKSISSGDKLKQFLILQRSQATNMYKPIRTQTVPKINTVTNPKTYNIDNPSVTLNKWKDIPSKYTTKLSKGQYVVTNVNGYRKGMQNQLMQQLYNQKNIIEGTRFINQISNPNIQLPTYSVIKPVNTYVTPSINYMQLQPNQISLTSANQLASIPALKYDTTLLNDVTSKYKYDTKNMLNMKQEYDTKLDYLNKLLYDEMKKNNFLEEINKNPNYFNKVKKIVDDKRIIEKRNNEIIKIIKTYKPKIPDPKIPDPIPPPPPLVLPKLYSSKTKKKGKYGDKRTRTPMTYQDPLYRITGKAKYKSNSDIMKMYMKYGTLNA